MNRRDFIKLAGALPVGLGLQPLLRRWGPSQPGADDRPNVLVIVFDAFSARHISLHGYARETTPNLARLAERAIVYHNHYAGGNYTTPGTASLLTGTLPWTHRAFQPNSRVAEAFARRSLFHAFRRHHRLAYSHNLLVNTLFKQFAEDLDEYVPRDQLFVTSDLFLHKAFAKDEDIADVAWARTAKRQDYGYAYSLFLSQLYLPYLQYKTANVARRFPLGLPSINSGNFFLLEDAVDWIVGRIGGLPQPYMGYFHFLPPHKPSAPPSEFFRIFAQDLYQSPVKPPDPLAGWKETPRNMDKERREYDEYILYVDREFGRLFDRLEESGALSNTWVVLSSDHGELFERGFRGHGGPLFYEGVVRVPLMIFEPKRTERVDIQVRTSGVDVLPTLLHVTGEQAVDWTDGSVLPPFAPADPERPVYALDARKANPDGPIEAATLMLIKGRYKLTYFFGYKELGEGVERVDLFDIESDPEELNNLYTEGNEIGASMLALLKGKLEQVNAPYL